MLYQTLISATNAGAAILSKYFNTSFSISNKEGLNNLVTEADLAAEAAIIAVIRQHFPDHNILCEEVGSKDMGHSHTWIIDPIDGTVNFAHGIPLCCVSIGLEVNGSMLMGAVYNPIMQEFFIAEKGKGAYLNDVPISVSKKTEFLKACMVTGFPYKYLEAENGPLQVFERLLKLGIPVRRLGSAALDLCWTAAGRFDCFYEHSLQPWDSAAGFLIVEEAGGSVTHMDGSTFNPRRQGIVASNSILHQEMLQFLQQI